jgi:hypothetical protein
MLGGPAKTCVPHGICFDYSAIRVGEYRAGHKSGLNPEGGSHRGDRYLYSPPIESDEERDARFAPGNDKLWGPGNWIRCPTCPHDYFDHEVYHHKDAHNEQDQSQRT